MVWVINKIIFIHNLFLISVTERFDFQGARTLQKEKEAAEKAAEKEAKVAELKAKQEEAAVAKKPAAPKKAAAKKPSSAWSPPQTIIMQIVLV